MDREQEALKIAEENAFTAYDQQDEYDDPRESFCINLQDTLAERGLLEHTELAMLHFRRECDRLKVPGEWVI